MCCWSIKNFNEKYHFLNMCTMPLLPWLTKLSCPPCSVSTRPLPLAVEVHTHHWTCLLFICLCMQASRKLVRGHRHFPWYFGGSVDGVFWYLWLFSGFDWWKLDASQAGRFTSHKSKENVDTRVRERWICWKSNTVMLLCHADVFFFPFLVFCT